ncbi:MAG: lysophospholipid acyltransferase family protein [Thermodesulfovibrionales bacterium]
MNRCLPYEDGAYRTPSATASVLSRALPSLSFYLGLAPHFVRAARAAKDGRLGPVEFCQASLGVLRALERTGVTVEVTGAENFMGLGGPCVFVANHMSTLETFVLPALTLPYREITFVVKESLLRTPMFGHIMKALGAIPVGRTNPREDLRAVLEEGSRALSRGTSLVVFPQATRTDRLEPSKFNTLGIKLARRTGAPVIPVAIKSDAWGTGGFIKDFGKIDPSLPVLFSFGQPLSVEGRGTVEHEKVLEFIGEKLAKWGKGGLTAPP